MPALNVVKGLALITAGIALIVLPEPVTTAIGISLITKGFQELKKKSSASEEVENIEEPPQHLLIELHLKNNYFLNFSITFFA